MRLIHTLLFLFRENKIKEDTEMAFACLKSLEKSSHKTVVVYNQGYMKNDQLKDYLSMFNLDFHIIGESYNVGTTIGRQKCFDYIWDCFPNVEYISEVHLDMFFTPKWEDTLVGYLDTHEEPMISCGIVDQHGNMPFLGKSVILPEHDNYDSFFSTLCENKIMHGFTVPCIHVSEILKKTGGYNPLFLRGKQCFEDDSMLLGYYYYYGTRINWYPKINFNSVVYHAIAGQRIDLDDNIMINYNGLVKQYGAMGIKHLTILHKSEWHKNYFSQQYEIITNQ